jgi:hypothetical protein
MTKPNRQTRIATTAGIGIAHAFKGFGDWIEVFKAGTHTDAKGCTVSFSEGDLDQMVANIALGAAPAVLGHPKHDDPAYGWADQVKREGASLFAKFSDVHPEFEAGVASGAYRNRSVSVIKDADHGWRLQHVGWLGAMRPAIAGLKPVAFAADQVDAHEFSADDLTTSWAIGDIASLFRGLRDWLIGEKGVEVADRTLPTWSIDSVNSAATRIREQAMVEEATCMPAGSDALATGLAPMFTAADQPGGHNVPNPLTQADIDRAVAEATERVRAETSAQFSAQTTATAAELAALRAERQAERIGLQVTDWTAKGLVTPAEASGLKEFMAAIDGQAQEFTFSAATGEVKKTPAQWFAAFMAARKPVVKLGLQLGGDDTAAPGLDAADPQAIAHQAREYQAAEAAKGHTIAIDQAVTAVMARAAKAA